MKKVYTAVLMLIASGAFAGTYYENQQTSSSATVRVAGVLKVAPKATPQAPSITLNGDGGVVTATSFVGALTGSASGNAGTATALAVNGTNCSAGNYPLGVDASGNAEGCTAAVGSGDAVIAGTQTWSGANTYTNPIGFTAVPTPASPGTWKLYADSTLGALAYTDGSGTLVTLDPSYQPLVTTHAADSSTKYLSLIYGLTSWNETLTPYPLGIKAKLKSISCDFKPNTIGTNPTLSHGTSDYYLAGVTGSAAEQRVTVRGLDIVLYSSETVRFNLGGSFNVCQTAMSNYQCGCVATIQPLVQ